jgi:N-acyl-D-amino-acid deacylase
MAASDSGVRSLSTTGNAKPHPRGFGTMARFLSVYVRDQQLMTWGEGIRRITGLPAEVMGWQRRGRLAPGALADVCIFSTDDLADRATYINPIAAPAGIRHVLVSGQFVVRDGEHTGARPGRVIKRGQSE